MRHQQNEVFTAPWLLGTAFLLVGTAIVEKGLNLVGGDIPLLDVYPRQLLEWAMTLLILDIALSLRQLVDRGASVPSNGQGL